MNGLYNGVGGKIEPGELPLMSMIREFTEETGLTHFNWTINHEEHDDKYHSRLHQIPSKLGLGYQKSPCAR